MKSKLLLLLLLNGTLLNAVPPAEEGKAIFSTRCAGCHNVHKQVLGPALAGVDQRRTIDWIINFVHSSQTMVKSGDKDAVALFNQFNNIPMPDHKDLTDGQIRSVVEYIKSEAIKVGTAQHKVADEKQPSLNLLQQVLANPALLLAFSMLAVLLMSVLHFAWLVTKYRKTLATGK